MVLFLLDLLQLVLGIVEVAEEGVLALLTLVTELGTLHLVALLAAVYSLWPVLLQAVCLWVAVAVEVSATRVTILRRSCSRQSTTCEHN